jgi:hypothetical protein
MAPIAPWDSTRSISGHAGEQMQRLYSAVSNGEQAESLTRILKLMPPPVGKDGGPATAPSGQQSGQHGAR